MLRTRNFARSLDLEAKKIAEICKISRPCVNRILREIRILIAKECEKISKMSGEIEVDESYFGAKRVHSKRGLGLARKRLCFYFVLHTRNCKQKVC